MDLLQGPSGSDVANWLDSESPCPIGYMPMDPREHVARELAMINYRSDHDDWPEGDTLPVAWWLLHRVELVHETTGEIMSIPRLVFSDDDGNVIASTSTGVIRDWSIVVRELGSGPWIPPLTIRLVEGTSRRGRVFHTLQVV